MKINKESPRYPVGSIIIIRENGTPLDVVFEIRGYKIVAKEKTNETELSYYLTIALLEAGKQYQKFNLFNAQRISLTEKNLIAVINSYGGQKEILIDIRD